MKIQWLGHSCFKLEESTGTTIVADPYDLKKTGYNMPKVRADVVTLSNSRNSQVALQSIEGDATIITELGTWEIKGVDIMSLLSNTDERFGAKDRNMIFKYRLDGVDVCHMGDVRQECTVKLSETIGTVNVLLVPIGGTYTIDAEQAKEYIDFLMPDIVIPMHFKTANSKVTNEKLGDFLELFEEEQIVEVDGESIEFDRSQFDGGSTQVIVFNSSNF